VKKFFTALITVAIIVGLIVAVRMFGLTGKIEEAHKRIVEAFQNIVVEYPMSDGDGSRTTAKIDDFLQNVKDRDGNSFYHFVTVNIDFQRILGESVVEKDDFKKVQDRLDKYASDIASDLGLVFKRTNNISIKQANSSILEEYDKLDKIAKMRDFSMELDSFLSAEEGSTSTINSNKYLSVETEFGCLYLCSDLFSGKTDLLKEKGIKISFGYDRENAITEILIIDTKGEEKSVENAEKSILLTIPLEFSFMREGSYDAVMYIDAFDNASDILPRSFRYGDNLYVFANRTGRFKLTKTPNGSTNNKRIHLADRGMELKPTDGNLVSRAAFFFAIMQIYWVEDIYFNTEDIVSFPDVSDEELTKRLNVGRKYGILTGKPSSNPELPNPFDPNDALTRAQMFQILAGFIKCFGIIVDREMPYDPNAIGTPSNENNYWWYRAFYELAEIGFVPYRIIDGVKYVAAEEPATLEECHEVLYALITSTRIWR
jgi:hypothetical protein